jgi:hypothetical protein
MSKRRWKRKLGLALFGLAFLAPLLAFGVSNLFLVSPKGRALIADKISRQLQLEAKVQGATWSPWNGITIYGLRLEQPDLLRKSFKKPLLSVQSVRIHPDWSALREKTLSLKGMDVVKPDFTIPIELLSQIPQREVSPPLVAKPPDLAAAKPPTGHSAPQRNPVTPTPPNPGVTELVPPVQQLPPIVKSVPAEPSPAVWINIHEGSLGIVSLMSPAPLFHAGGINGSVPLAGKPTESRISVGKMTGLDGKDLGKITLPLKWDAPILTLQAVGGEISGMDFKVAGQIALTQGNPFRIDVAVPEQKDRKLRVAGNALANLGVVMAQGRAQGFLRLPASWQGQWIAQAGAIDAEMGGLKNHFGQGQALVIFQSGVLRCVDARLIGEDASIIGNAMLLSDGRMAGIARIVAAPESLVAISRITRPDSTPPHLTPLSTPQRSALDIQIYGRPGKLFYQSDPMSAPLQLR